MYYREHPLRVEQALDALFLPPPRPAPGLPDHLPPLHHIRQPAIHDILLHQHLRLLPNLGRMDPRHVCSRHLHNQHLLLLHHVLEQHLQRYSPPRSTDPDSAAAAGAYQGQDRTRSDVHDGVHVSAALYDACLPLAYRAGSPG